MYLSEVEPKLGEPVERVPVVRRRTQGRIDPVDVPAILEAYKAGQTMREPRIKPSADIGHPQAKSRATKGKPPPSAPGCPVPTDSCSSPSPRRHWSHGPTEPDAPKTYVIRC
jgi:hypothetical protein